MVEKADGRASLAELVELLSRPVASTETDWRGLGDQIERLTVGIQQQVEASRENADALRTSAASKAGEALTRAALGPVASGSSWWGGLLGISPIISGLSKLIGGFSDRKAAEPSAVEFRLPSPVRSEVGLAQDGGTPVVTAFDALGLSRDVTARPAVAMSPPITINVNALDARSILDRSDDIASALRGALLQSHSVQDALNDL